jgi:YesN/AraC family two-component response regulator
MALYEDTKFLLLDDEDHFIQDNVKKLLELGFSADHIDIANDGVEGLKLISSNDYEFIITDLVMPNMNGLQFLEACLKLENAKHVPKIVVSASFDRSIVMEVMKSGARAFLVKPMDKYLLAQKLVDISEQNE